MTRLVFSNLSISLGKRRILKQTGLALEGGECILLTGKNGAGKTTLMRVLAGLEKPESCQIETSKGQYDWKQLRNTLQSQVMYLHQQPYMFTGTVHDNLNFTLPRSLPRTERHTRIQEITEWADLDDIIDANAKSLSGGECQRVAIARARLRNPQALLLDEPTASMDSDARVKTLNLLGQLCSENIALLVTSHDPELFQGIASRFLHLANQQITCVESSLAEDSV